MPIVKITVPHGAVRDSAALLADLSSRLALALCIPRTALGIHLNAPPPDGWVGPEDRGPRYTFVEILLLPGRSRAVKAHAVSAIAESLAPLGVPASDLDVAFIEVPRPDWAVGGALLADEP